MNALEVFKTLGIPPTDNFGEIRKAYLVRLKRLRTKAQKVKGTDEFYDIEDSILELNQAYNNINEGNVAEMYARAETLALQEKVLPKEIVEQYGLGMEEDTEYSNRPKSNVAHVLESLELVWEEKELDSIEETITLNDFMNGSLLMTEDNKTIELPPGFIGVITSIVGDKLRFINIRGKDSVTFAYDPKGNILLKALPEDATYDDKDVVRFSLRENEFEIPLGKFKWDTKLNMWVAKELGLKAYGSKKNGNMIIDAGQLKINKALGVGEKIKSFFDKKSKD